MIDEKEFSGIVAKLERLDALREEIILKSREITKNSKKAIFAVHRNDLKQAKSLLAAAQKEIKQLDALVKENPELLSTGAYHACIQEYVEAICYLTFVSEGTIPPHAKLGVDVYNYMLGISDLTGELQRRAVHAVIRKSYGDVRNIWETVNDIYEKFLELNLRNGDLRKKSDSIKWNLKRIEEIMYDISKNEVPASGKES